MYYKKIKLGDKELEFDNDWKGYEFIKINGQLVSKKHSVFGTTHEFTLREEDRSVFYTLTTRLTGSMEGGIVIDIRKEGILIMENIPIPYSISPGEPKNPMKKSGISKIKAFDIKEGIDDLIKAMKINAEDPEIYFYLACGYSNLEESSDAFRYLNLALENNLQNPKIIDSHEMLAFVRMQPDYEIFIKEYQLLSDGSGEK